MYGMSRRSAALLLPAMALMFSSVHAEDELSLEGTWTMVAAYEIQADGTRTTNYGEHPKGMLVVDRRGHYSVQIFRPDRKPFAAGVKGKGTTEELRDAVVGSSTHFGEVRIDPAKHVLVFRIAASSYPNWEGTEQVREYRYEHETLTYSVPASASGNGSIAYSIWTRVD